MKIYILIQDVYSGNIKLTHYTSAYSSYELAKEAADKVKEINKSDGRVQYYYTIDIVDLYESKDQVPILNNNGNIFLE